MSIDTLAPVQRSRPADGTSVRGARISAKGTEARSPCVFVDQTHCGRHVTGLERITFELFSAEALAPLPVVPIRASGRAGMMATQTFGLPFEALRHRNSIVLCPGFPPSAVFSLFMPGRVIPYIHDLFLLTRPQDLNRRAKLYMVEPFRLAVHRCPLMFANSEATAADLRRICRADAEIVLYRPRVRNVFGVEPAGRRERASEPGHFRLLAIGTLEPRKNLFAAAEIVAALRRSIASEAVLDVVGRPGWGVDTERLAVMPGVRLHGYQSVAAVEALLHQADALISTSHDEGLGLPLLEAQYAGLPVIAPNAPVFHEVLGASGIFIDTADPAAAARAIGSAVSHPEWRAAFVDRASANLRRWNAAAERDRQRVVTRVGALLAGAGP